MASKQSQVLLCSQAARFHATSVSLILTDSSLSQYLSTVALRLFLGIGHFDKFNRHEVTAHVSSSESSPASSFELAKSMRGGAFMAHLMPLLRVALSGVVR